MRVLIVDDHPGIRRAIASALEADGYQVLPPAADAADGLARIDDADVVVLDLHLPDMQDDELVDAFLEHGRPVVIHSSAPDRVASRPGVIAHVQKGDLERLLDAVGASADGG